MEITVEYRQSLMDIALQYCGNVSALVTLAKDNGLSITDDVETGQKIIINDSAIVDKEVVKFYKDKKITLANDIPRPNFGQTITIQDFPTLRINDTHNIIATASSGLFCRFTTSDESIASLEGNQITCHKAGTVTITAYQDGDKKYRPAKPVAVTFEVLKLEQTITFPNIADASVGDIPLFVPATASSGLTVTYTISDESIAYFAGPNLYFANAGTVTITANQAGNDTYLPASVSQEITVTKRTQSITFNLVDTAELSLGTIALSATASPSGLPITFVSSNPAVATISGNTLTLLSVGTTNITASQSGNYQYLPATDVIETLVVQDTAVSIPTPVFDFDPAQTGRFTLQNVSGVDYVESYTHNGYTISKNASASSTQRPFLDATGVRFQDNNFSHLFVNSDIPHKEIWIIFNCLQGATYKATDGNPIYANRNTSTVPLLRGDASSSRVSQLSFGTGAAGQISNTTWTSFTNLGVSNNANPISSFRVLYMSFPNLTRQVFYLGAGSNSGSSLILRPLNGYIKRALCFTDVLTAPQRTALLAQLKTQYGI